MWNGKKKAITFSFDDGTKQDVRLIQILDKYGLKATFNINSGRFGAKTPSNVIEPNQVKEIYQGHEVAAHTVTHFNLTELPDSCVIWQVEEDRKMLERLTGKEVCCMAYPCGEINNDERVASLIKNNTAIRFARTITPTYSFDMQDNLWRFNPTLHFLDEKVFELAEQFISLNLEEDKLFYIWGHSFELDRSEERWVHFEKLCALISGKDDIFYGTNREIFKL